MSVPSAYAAAAAVFEECIADNLVGLEGALVCLTGRNSVYSLLNGALDICVLASMYSDTTEITSRLTRIEKRLRDAPYSARVWCFSEDSKCVALEHGVVRPDLAVHDIFWIKHYKALYDPCGRLPRLLQMASMLAREQRISIASPLITKCHQFADYASDEPSVAWFVSRVQRFVNGSEVRPLSLVKCMPTGAFSLPPFYMDHPPYTCEITGQEAAAAVSRWVHRLDRLRTGACRAPVALLLSQFRLMAHTLGASSICPELFMNTDAQHLPVGANWSDNLIRSILERPSVPTWMLPLE